MNLLNTMKVGSRVFLIVVVLLVLTGVVAAVGLVKMNQIGGELQSIAEQDLPLTTAITKVAEHQLQIGILFNLLIWLAIATVFISMLFRHFGSLDTSLMKQLKD